MGRAAEQAGLCEADAAGLIRLTMAMPGSNLVPGRHTVLLQHPDLRKWGIVSLAGLLGGCRVLGAPTR